ncbi:hypothetical protein C5S32_05160, partial [ANME-1 cluster archaeon GoMg1]|nr:hypothetical protein [ANME-1 cluster archaeon GoMg1]
KLWYDLKNEEVVEIMMEARYYEP